jgi:hypothetical protein
MKRLWTLMSMLVLASLILSACVAPAAAPVAAPAGEKPLPLAAR